jgi:DinB superfamily
MGFMSKVIIGRPEAGEFAEFYSGYVSKVPGTDVLSFLQQQMDSATSLIREIPESQGDHTYASGKWSIKELLGHVIDTERVFAYRALVFGRNDTAALPGFDQDQWIQNSNYGNLSIRQILAEFESVRRATLLMLQGLPPAAWGRRGTANDKQMSTRGAAFVIAGHTQHHLDILNSRYLHP